MTTSTMARPTTGAGPAPKEPPMTVTDNDLRNLLDLIRRGRVEVSPNWNYVDRLERGTVVDDAVYEAEKRGLVQLLIDGSITNTKAGRQWLSGKAVTADPTSHAVVFQPPAVA